MTPEQITATAAIVVSFMGAGGCCAAVLTPLGVVLGVIGQQVLAARKAKSETEVSEAKMLRDNIEESRRRYQEEIEITRKRCAEDRLSDRMEANTWREESNRLERENTELVDKLNGERKENYRIRALAFQAGFTIPDERRASDFTKQPVIEEIKTKETP